MKSNAIKTNRVRVGLTQQELADAIGVESQTISLWERNRSNPRKRYVQFMKQVFGMNDN